jgi:hypothetical protein
MVAVASYLPPGRRALRRYLSLLFRCRSSNKRIKLSRSRWIRRLSLVSSVDTSISQAIYMVVLVVHYGDGCRGGGDNKSIFLTRGTTKVSFCRECEVGDDVRAAEIFRR